MDQEFSLEKEVEVVYAYGYDNKVYLSVYGNGDVILTSKEAKKLSKALKRLAKQVEENDAS